MDDKKTPEKPGTGDVKETLKKAGKAVVNATIKGVELLAVSAEQAANQKRYQEALYNQANADQHRNWLAKYDYPICAGILLRCLKDHHGRCGLECPTSSTQIMAPAEGCVDYNGFYHFVVQPEIRPCIRGQEFEATSNTRPYTEIMDMLNSYLPNYYGDLNYQPFRIANIGPWLNNSIMLVVGSAV